MNILDRTVLYVGVPLAVIFAILCFLHIGKIGSPPPPGVGKGPPGAGRRPLGGTVQTVSIEKQTGPTPSLSCYADNAWVSITSSQDTFFWVNTIASDVTITFDTAALRDNAGNPVNSPVTLKAAGTGGSTMGPYHVDGGTVNACQANGSVASCYLSYDVISNAKSCEDHDVHYFTGIQITR